MTVKTAAARAASACTIAALALLAGCRSLDGASAPQELDSYNVVWQSPSADSAGSMPIGNGTLGANTWVEKNGDLVLLLSRTDAWSENERLLKLGEVRVALSPNPLARGGSMRQELMLRDGKIEIALVPPQGDHESSSVTLQVWVDSSEPVVHVSTQSERPVKVVVSGRTWRDHDRRLTDADELRSTWSMRDAPAGVEVAEAGDVVVGSRRAPRAIAWYHRNEHSIVPFTLDRQGLGKVAGAFSDPLLHRTFGCWIEGEGFSRSSDTALEGTGTSLDIAIATDSSQTASIDAWLLGVESRARSGAGTRSGAGASLARTSAWWNSFWGRSWIFIDGDPGLGEIPDNGHPIRVGADSNGQNVFRGEMQHPVLFFEALSDEKIAMLARSRDEDVTGEAATRFSHTREAINYCDHGARVMTEVGEIDGKPGGVWSFRGGHMEFRKHAVDSFTVSAWIHPEARGDGTSPSPARIFDKLTAGTSDGFLFDTHPGRNLRLIAGTRTLDAKDVVTPGEWQHVAATYDAGSGAMKIYLNGTPVAEKQGTGSGDEPPPSQITRSYILQRWILACSSRGSMYPPKFNGSIFTVEPLHVNGSAWNADWRAWGGSYWWQNTRLPYYPMLAAGDYDLMQPLFDFYGAALKPSTVRANTYYNARGAYFPETMTMFFTYANGDYGWSRDGLAAGDISPCPWWRWAWNQSLELTQIMLDRYEHTEDESFLRERALPMASATLDYFESRFLKDGPGGAKLEITPTQAIETYWKGVVDDAPSVAGIRCVTQRLLELPEGLLSSAERQRARKLLDACPAIPVETVDGVRVMAPARVYANERTNSETPELYPVFPFGLVGIGRPDIAPAIEAYTRRHDKATVGWTQDGAFAAMLGLAGEARTQLVSRARNSHPSFRFPAMWGPNFDWLPDQCHGGNLMLLTQLMLMQSVGDTIYLVPAWPQDWSARFRLHAPKNTVVEARVEKGKVVELNVWPHSRRKDVVVWDPAMQRGFEQGTP